LSLAGSAFRNFTVVEVLVAVNVVMNLCHACCVAQVVQLFVNMPNAVALAKTLTVLVTPKPVFGLSTFPTQNVNVYESPMLVAMVCETPSTEQGHAGAVEDQAGPGAPGHGLPDF
jgi:hypothetical protein